MKSRKFFYIFIFTIFNFCINALGFDNFVFPQKNYISLNAFGHGGIGSINYERIFYNTENYKMNANIGIGFSNGFIHANSAINLPFTINNIVSFENKHLELGLGYLFSSSFIEPITQNNDTIYQHILLGKIGYRFQKEYNEDDALSNLFYCFAFTPYVVQNEKLNGFNFMPFVGISIGYGF